MRRHPPLALALAALTASGCWASTYRGCSSSGGGPRFPPPFDAGCFGCSCPRACFDASRPIDSSPRPDVRRSSLLCDEPGARGEACVARTCADGSMCLLEDTLGGLIAVRPDGSPAPPLDLRVFPGSVCASSCDPEAASACPACASCESELLVGRFRFAVPAVGAVCLPRCEPTLTDRGGCRAGYACDPLTGTCQPACESDDVCAYRIGDPDGDGSHDVVYDPLDGSHCDAVTGRCAGGGRAGASPGSPCTDHSDCAGDDGCLLPVLGGSGLCVRPFCSEVLPCVAGAACVDTARLDGDTAALLARVHRACFHGCIVGGELDLPTEEQRAAILGGAHPGCLAGQSCIWDGTSAPGGLTDGACVPGNVSAETEYDVGSACTSDDECFSPFGLGRCLGTSDGGPGICAISSCAGDVETGLLTGPGSARALPPEWQALVCDLARGDVCTPVELAPLVTYCLPSCSTADDCAPATACVTVDVGSVCWPRCFSSSQCRAGETCGGPLCASELDCRCEPMPIDGGIGETDAGVPDDASSDAG